MRAKEVKKVKSIASEVRKWGETLYNQFCYEDWDCDLCGMCAVCSYQLARTLRERGFKAWILVNNGDCPGCHAFVRVGSMGRGGLTVDITATQFGYTDKVLVRNRVGDKDWVWTDMADPLDEDKVADIFYDWPKTQHPILFDNYGEVKYS